MQVSKDLVAASATPLVLAILLERESYGYAILKRVAELSGGELTWTDGMLYPLLHRLERLGYVAARWGASESGRKRKYYRITQAGRAQLAVQRRQWQVVESHPAAHLVAGGSGPGLSMADENTPETQIAQWRAHLLRSGAVNPADVEELESHLREQMAALVDAGLAVEEAFLVAVKRMGNIDAVSREFARVHSERLWKQLVAEPAGGGDRGPTERTETAAVVGLALAAAAAIKVPELFGHQFGSAGSVGFYARNASLFILPLLTGYFVWKRGWEVVRSLWLAVAFVAATVLANAFPFTPDGATGILSAIHLPIALWLAVGIAYAGGRWNSVAGRMDFVRFSGELFIYYVLFALGGGVLALFTGTMFRAIGLDVGRLIETWLLPCGALGAVIVGRLAGGAEEECHREHGAGAHARVHAAVRGRAAGVSGDHGVDRQRHRRRPRGAHRLRPAAGSGGRPAAVRGVGARPAGAARRVRRAAAAPGGGGPGGRRGGAGGDRGAHLRVRPQRQQSRGAGREPHPAGQSGGIGLALRTILARRRPIRRPWNAGRPATCRSTRCGPPS